MISISSAVQNSQIRAAVPQKADSVRQEATPVQSAEEWRASAEQDAADLASGKIGIASIVDFVAVDLSKYTFSKAGSGADPMASLAERRVENHDVVAGSVEQVGFDRLHDVISKLAEDIGDNAFKGMTFYGARDGIVTNSADVFLGWLKDKEATLAPGNLVSKTA